jgi:hypothetical protein
MTTTNSISLLVALIGLLAVSFAWDQQDYYLTVEQMSSYIACQGNPTLYGPSC